MAKKLEFVMLLDCYGELLTEHQKNIMELYYCEDLSLAEISEPLGITRQAVQNMLRRAEKVLLNYEEKLGFAKRLEAMRCCFGNIRSAAAGLDDASLKLRIENEVAKGLELL